MDNAWSSSAVYRFDGDSLAISPRHSSNSEGSMRFGVHLGKALMALKDKLAGLEVEKERGHFLAVLMTTGERAYALLTHTSTYPWPRGSAGDTHAPVPLPARPVCP